MLDQIYTSALKFLIPLTLEETYKTVVEEGIKLVNGKDGSLFIPQEDGTLQRAYTSNPLLEQITPRLRGNTYKVYREGVHLLLKKAEIEKIHPDFKSLQVGSDILIALQYKNKVRGVLSVLSHYTTDFTEKDLETLKTFSPLASLAIRNATLHNDLVKAIETRDFFISMASHELKTPITSITLNVDLLKRMVERGKQPSLNNLERLANEVARLTRLVNELLQVNYIRSGMLQFKKERCKITDIINRAINDFIFMYPQHSVQFNNKLVPDTIQLSCDFDKMLQVFINILNNAGKHTSEKSSISITAYKTDNSIRIDITDAGKGIPKEDLPYVFDLFYRGKNAPSKGMGLGLYLSKYIVEEHKGSIIINSELNKGTTVSVLMPIQ